MAARTIQTPRSLHMSTSIVGHRAHGGPHVAKIVHPRRCRKLHTGLQGRRCQLSVVSATDLADIPPELPEYDMVRF
eukprot:938539-Pyramimonas_sp.AAC.1